MDLLRALQEGGIGAWGALLLGLVALGVGVVALVSALTFNPRAFRLGLATLVLATVAAGAGLAGQLRGQQLTDQALGQLANPVDVEQLRHEGYREAQSAALLGSLAGLLPFLLGAFTSVFAARAKTGEDDTGRLVLAVGFAGLAALSCAGAWALSHRLLPPVRYDFPTGDEPAWRLAAALDAVNANTPEGCARLEAALDAYWHPANRNEWPRVMGTEISPALSSWRAAADACVSRTLARLDPGPDRTAEWTRLWDSPLLQNEALKRQLTSATEVPVAPTRPSPASLSGVSNRALVPAKPTVVGSLDPELVKKVIHSNRGQVRYCYESQLNRFPALRGRLAVKFIISPQGTVPTASLVTSSVGNADLERCVLGRVRTWVFPKPKGGGVAIVTFPFQFAVAPN